MKAPLVRAAAARAALLGLALSAKVPAAAQNLLMTTPIPQAVHSPDGPAWSTGSLRVRSAGYAGSFTVVVTSLGLSPAPIPDPLVWGLWRNPADPSTALSLDGAPASAAGVITGSFPPGGKGNERLDVPLSLVVAAGSLPAPGTYTASLRADLYAGGFPAVGKPVDSLGFQASILVATRSDLALVERGRTFSLAATALSLDFGDLGAPVGLGLDIVARSNASWSLSLSSAGGWALVPLGGAANAPSIPYGIRADGLALAPLPGASLELARNSGATGASGRRVSLDLLPAAPVELLPEGRYADTLTFTISAP